MSQQTIILGGGGFWCIEATMQLLRGVVRVTSGYAGGVSENPSYARVAYGTADHAEVVEVIFDSEVIALETILSAFFTVHDPTQLNRQGNDVGPQYRSMILYTTDQQRIGIEKYIQELEGANTFHDPIVTEVKPLVQFFPAEKEHQNYYQNNRGQGYCQVIIDPKIAQLRSHFSAYLKK